MEGEGGAAGGAAGAMDADGAGAGGEGTPGPEHEGVEGGGAEGPAGGQQQPQPQAEEASAEDVLAGQLLGEIRAKASCDVVLQWMEAKGVESAVGAGPEGPLRVRGDGCDVRCMVYGIAAWHTVPTELHCDARGMFMALQNRGVSACCPGTMHCSPAACVQCRVARLAPLIALFYSHHLRLAAFRGPQFALMRCMCRC